MALSRLAEQDIWYLLYLTEPANMATLEAAARLGTTASHQSEQPRRIWFSPLAFGTFCRRDAGRHLTIAGISSGKVWY